MYLKRLVLRGFKSFASTTSLIFEPGITCVVGPNGSGKSNVVDALSWVMGEQGPKSLRGASMEDVIFAGTSQRSQLGRAEVQLTIDNSDQALPIDYTEVTISRTKFRNGSSEYSINGTPCRLLDVRELLSDSGIGREMHVIVGQGQLDTILQATPETRRGLIEEAAGVLKHRERKEKALRKLDATETNLNRLTDLVTEIRRQLKPLGRQAEVARRASLVQAELRDAKARLLADDLVQATAALAEDLASEADAQAEREATERRLVQARQAEETAQTAVAAAVASLNQAQETWYRLSGLAEQVRSTLTLAGERIRHAELQTPAESVAGRDPETLEAQAAETTKAELALRSDIVSGGQALAQASAQRQQSEAAHASAEAEFAAALRAEADRREDLARLAGQAASLRSRVESAEEQIVRQRQAIELAQRRQADSQTEGAELAQRVERLTQATTAADQALRSALSQAEEANRKVAGAQTDARQWAERRSGLAARVEALRLTEERPDGAAALVERGDPAFGLLGPAADLITVERGYEAALAAALGPAAEAWAARDRAGSLRAIDHLKGQDLGRVSLLLGDAPALSGARLEGLAAGQRPALDCVQAQPSVRAALSRLLADVVVVEDLAGADDLVRRRPELTAVTRDGDMVRAGWAVGGSAGRLSAIEVRAAIERAEAELSQANRQLVDQEAAGAQARTDFEQAEAVVRKARQSLDQARSHQAAAVQQASLAEQAGRVAQAEAERLARQLEQVEAVRRRDGDGLTELNARLARAQAGDDPEQSPSPDRLQELAERAKAARAGEMESRLALRTVEERARSLAGRAEALRQAAEEERQARARAAAAQAELAAEAARAAVVARAATWLAARVEASLALAATVRAEAGRRRESADAAVTEARRLSRQLSEHLETIVDTAHRDELARAQQRMRIDALAERALAEVGLEPDTLMAEYGPDRPIPSNQAEPDPDTGQVPTHPFVREEQLKRLRMADRDLQLLGRINPLALEEYDAMQERHRFLAEQLDDLKRTRSDLLAIVDDVDARVQAVFAQAYTDVEREFTRVFARLFPGGQGRLFLTEPGQWLTTGVDVEARPAGKNVKRLSLLSGGERSLVAICFLVALFKARPSPFYILDEVEAALDDANLGRLLEIYEELRRDSQLIVITHQKRTMEIADVLYGVSMRDDGISNVVSQRLRTD